MRLRFAKSSYFLLLLLLLLLLFFFFFLITRLHDHARCLIGRGDHVMKRAVDDVHSGVVLAVALYVLDGSSEGSSDGISSQVASQPPRLLPAHENRSARMR